MLQLVNNNIIRSIVVTPRLLQEERQRGSPTRGTKQADGPLLMLLFRLAPRFLWLSQRSLAPGGISIDGDTCTCPSVSQAWLRRRVPYLPAAGSQVLQSPSCSLQGVWVGALRQQCEVGLDNGGVPQHLDAFGGLRQIWKGANAIPLWRVRHHSERGSMSGSLPEPPPPTTTSPGPAAERRSLFINRV